jgi:L-asparagine oxygenase
MLIACVSSPWLNEGVTATIDITAPDITVPEVSPPDVSPSDVTVLDEAFVLAAARSSRSLPAEIDDALIDFRARPDRSGALLLRGLPIGELPATPARPDAPTGKDLATESMLLAVASRLGHPVGYAPEHGGRIVQNIVPTLAGAELQVSTSSRSTLMFHTETAFHPHRPRYLLLLCLRGDPAAHTTMASVFDVVEAVGPEVAASMFERRYRTAVDASFLDGRANVLGDPHALLTGTLDEPTFVFDADLTVGTDDAATRTVDLVRDAIEHVQTSVVLEPGDLLVIDNNRAVHGRSPFPARFDGTDRWLQRAFVVADLAPSAPDRHGRVITTTFGR